MSNNLTPQERLDKLASQGIKHHQRTWLSTIRRSNRVHLMHARKVRTTIEISLCESLIVGDQIEVSTNQVFVMSHKDMKQNNSAADMVMSYFDQELSRSKKLHIMQEWNEWLGA